MLQTLKVDNSMDAAAIRVESLRRLKQLPWDAEIGLPIVEPLELRRTPQEAARRANTMHVLYAISLCGADSTGEFHTLLQDHGWDQDLCEAERQL
ncbi:MAG: hypothetical protein AAFX99_09235, partial [Myxococcota bacterium]